VNERMGGARFELGDKKADEGVFLHMLLQAR
jgi:hypothetical protein